MLLYNKTIQTSELIAARITSVTGSGVPVSVHRTSRDWGNHIRHSPGTSTPTV
jgi:hypothetical protein